MERIRSKVDAMVYAIEATKGKMGVDLKKAMEVYEHITDRVALPDVANNHYADLLENFRNAFGLGVGVQ